MYAKNEIINFKIDYFKEKFSTFFIRLLWALIAILTIVVDHPGGGVYGGVAESCRAPGAQPGRKVPRTAVGVAIAATGSRRGIL